MLNYLLFERKYVSSLFERPQGSLQFVDGLRAISCLWVFMFHAVFYWDPYINCFLQDVNPVMWLANSGDQPVDVFFVLAGFFSALSHFKQLDAGKEFQPFAKYVINRIIRLYPTILLTLWIFGRKGIIATGAATFSINYNPNTMVHYWSTCVDTHLYLLAPMVCKLMWRGKPYCYLVPICISIASTVAIWYQL